MSEPQVVSSQVHGASPEQVTVYLRGSLIFARLRDPWLWAMLAVLICAGIYVFWDAARPFNQTDEFLYAGVIKEMLASGDFVTPRFAHLTLLTKPPMFYWVSAPFMSVLDQPQVATRLIPGLSFIIAIALIFRIMRTQWSPRVAVLAGLIFFLCYDHLFNHVYRAGVMEGVLNLLMLVTLWLNLQLREAPQRIRWIAVVLALALLTKSAFAVIPGALTLANVWLNRRHYRITPRLLMQSMGLFLAIILPWVVLVILEHGRLLFDYMIVDQVWKRAINDSAAAASTGRTFGRQENFYVLRHFLEYGQPWSLLVWPSLWFAMRQQPEIGNQRSLLLRLCVGWFVGVLVLFTVVQGRWSWYISSAYIPATILIAAMLREFWRNADGHMAVWVWAAICAAFVLSQTPFLLNPYRISSGSFPLYGDPGLQLFCFLMLVVVVYGMCSRWKGGYRESLARERSICVLGLAVAASALLIVAAHRDFESYSLSLVTGSVSALMCLAVLSLVPMRHWLVTRVTAMTCVVTLALAYIVVPLGSAMKDNRRSEIKHIENLLATGDLSKDSPLVFGSSSLFSFIPVYAIFSDDYDVKYDGQMRSITISARE